MKVSIIIPNYNCARFLEQTLQSVLSQTGPELEVIVVDGASTDGSVDIIRRHASRLAYWVSEKDRGQTDAINKGLLRSTGDIVNWINSDDLLVPGALERICRGFAERPEADFVYGDLQIINEAGELLQTRPEISFSGFVQRYGGNVCAQPSTFFKRGSAERLGWLNPALHWSMDYEFYLRALNQQMVFHAVPEVVGQFRLHGGSKTGAQHKKFLEEHFRVHCSHTDSWLLRRRVVYRALKMTARCWRIWLLWRQRGVWQPGRYSRMLGRVSAGLEARA
jgi:glycosyltransferase involved in cell wall biosynthesis